MPNQAKLIEIHSVRHGAARRGATFKTGLTVTDMIKSETATLTYKAITGLTPSYLSNFFTKNIDRNIDINLRNAANDLCIPRITCKGQKAISYRGSKTWNQLSSDINEANSLNSFKCNVLALKLSQQGIFNFVNFLNGPL